MTIKKLCEVVETNESYDLYFDKFENIRAYRKEVFPAGTHEHFISVAWVKASAGDYEWSEDDYHWGWDSSTIYELLCAFTPMLMSSEEHKFRVYLGKPKYLGEWDRAHDIEEYMGVDDEEDDNVNHPSHYISNGIESIDVIEAFTKDLSGIEAFCTGNVIKYILRWKHKNGIEDLKKAKWYLDRIINSYKEEN